MKAMKVDLRCDTTFVVIEPEDHQHGALITINSDRASALADGIVRMVNESQCVICGKFNGLHGEVFVKTGQDGGGGVDGHYEMCAAAKTKK